MKNILVINSGSSSLKFQLIEMPQEEVKASGIVERIGQETGKIKYTVGTESISEEKEFKDHTAALKEITKALMDPEKGVIKNSEEIAAVGHRVVHGGATFTDTLFIDQRVKESIKDLFSLAPLHNPPNLTGIEVSEKIFPDSKQVAVFDTAFHQTIPEKAHKYAIPDSLYEKENIRLYGFHGTSHKYVFEQAQKELKNSDKIISIHLGNGCSITAIQNGKSIDHSLGFGPVNGLIMGTRSGDIDQSVIFYMIEQLGYSPSEVSNILHHKSGLTGLTGYSDLRDIEAEAEKGNKKCLLALEMSAYRIKKYIGAYAAAMNGLDAIIFTAGIGENSSTLRNKICEKMNFLGINIDPERNTERTNSLRFINTADSPVKILVVPTNEELEIARQTFNLFV